MSILGILFFVFGILDRSNGLEIGKEVIFEYDPDDYELTCEEEKMLSIPEDTCLLFEKDDNIIYDPNLYEVICNEDKAMDKSESDEILKYETDEYELDCNIPKEEEPPNGTSILFKEDGSVVFDTDVYETECDTEEEKDSSPDKLFSPIDDTQIEFPEYIQSSPGVSQDLSFCFPPVPSHIFECVPHVEKQPSVYQCPEFQCEGDETPLEDGYCCVLERDKKKWLFCWENERAKITTYQKSSDRLKGKPSCKPSRQCKATDPTSVQWKGEGCCEDWSGKYPRACCVEEVKDELEVVCHPLPVVRGDYIQCDDVTCADNGTCTFMAGQDFKCCQHKEMHGRQTCCSDEVKVLDFPNLVDIDLDSNKRSKFTCYPSYEKPPDNFQCPSFECVGGISHYGESGTGCCTFASMGQSWICCGDEPCIKSYNITSYPRCEEKRCQIDIEHFNLLLERGCCEEKDGDSSYTCCAHKYADDRPYIQCFPNHARPATPLICLKLLNEPVELCHMIQECKSVCCVHEINKALMTCCISDCPL